MAEGAFSCTRTSFESPAEGRTFQKRRKANCSVSDDLGVGIAKSSICFPSLDSVKRLEEAFQGGRRTTILFKSGINALPAPTDLGLSPSADWARSRSTARSQHCIPQETYLHGLAVLVPALGSWRQLGPWLHACWSSHSQCLGQPEWSLTSHLSRDLENLLHFQSCSHSTCAVSCVCELLLSS